MEIKVNKAGLTEEEFLKNYNAGDYDRPSMTVDMLIFTLGNKDRENYRKLSKKTLQLLLIKRGDHPCIGQWALPGGFVDIAESIDDAAKRELKEETNLEDIYMEQLYTWGDVERDKRTRIISCSYMALVDSSKLEVKAGDDAVEARWFDIDYSVLSEKNDNLGNNCKRKKEIQVKLVNNEIKLDFKVIVSNSMYNGVVKNTRYIQETNGVAFDHPKIIEYGLERLRNKIEHTDIVFSLMSECFTLSELQQVYEIILGKKLLPAAFRRKIANRVVETGKLAKDAGHRPSKFYKFKY